MKCVVLSLGGSLISEGGASYIKDVSAVLKSAAAETKIAVVVGGGQVARMYIDTARQLGAAEEYLDLVGIAFTRLHARLLIFTLEKLGCDVYARIALSVAEAANALMQHRIVVMGGTYPGHSTDTVAANLCVELGARLVNATVVDGIYTADPRTDKTAAKLDKVSYAELVSMLGGKWETAGKNLVIDPVAAKIIAEHAIPCCVIPGFDILRLKNALLGKKCAGTVVGAWP